MVRFSLFCLLFLIFGIIASFFYLAHKSQTMDGSYSLSSDKLNTCPNQPNCVSSFNPEDSEQYVSPIIYKRDSLDPLQEVLENDGFDIVKSRENYIYATHKTGFFGFVDDVEILLKEGKAHFRSSSRVGYSDLGKNRSRIEAIKFQIAQSL